MTKPELTAIARIAVRTARRNWKRTVLIVTLIAVPVAASQIAAGMIAAGKVAPEEYVTQELGAADVVIRSYAPSDSSMQWVDERIRELAPGGRSLRFRNAFGSIPDLASYVEISDLAVDDSLAAGKLAHVEGKLPVSAGEVALSDGLMSLTGASIGDVVQLTVDGTSWSESVTVVGTIRDVLYRNRHVAIVAPDSMDSLFANDDNGFVRVGADLPSANFIAREAVWLVETPDPQAFTAAIQQGWDKARADFRPTAKAAKPAVLDFLDQDLFVSLTAAQVEELADFASSLEPGELASADYTPNDPESDSAYYDFIVAVHQKLDTMLGQYPAFPETWASTEADLLIASSAADAVLEVPAVMGSIIAALLMAEVALVAGAAYATGIRRRLREVGLMSVNGATTQHVRWMVVGEGLVSGVLGAAIGSVLALGALTAGRPIAQSFIDRFIVGLPLGPIELLAPALIGVGAATIAAWIPARAAARVPAVTALDGRMPLAPPRRWVVPLGVATSGFGTFLLVVAKTSFGQSGTVQAGLGVVLMIGGFALMSGPIVEWVGRRADRFPAVVRLVLRDSARQRTRAATAIAATMVVLVAPVAAGTAIKTEVSRSAVYGLAENPSHVLLASPSSYDMPPQIDVDPAEVSTVLSVLPFAQHVQLDVYSAVGAFADSSAVIASGPLVPGALPQEAMVVARATPELLTALEIGDRADNLASGEAIVLGVADRQVQLRIGDSLIDAVEVPAHVMQFGFPRILVSADVAESLELGEPLAAALFVNDRPLTDGDRLHLSESTTARPVWPELLTPTQQLWIIGGAALLVVLLIVALVTALAATESDNDIRTMVAVGAPPHIRRRFLGVQTVYYTLFAALLAAPLALLLLKVSVNDTWVDVGPFGSFSSDTIEIPWLMIGIVIVGIPAVVGGLTALTVRSAATVAPRRLG